MVLRLAETLALSSCAAVATKWPGFKQKVYAADMDKPRLTQRPTISPRASCNLWIGSHGPKGKVCQVSGVEAVEDTKLTSGSRLLSAAKQQGRSEAQSFSDAELQLWKVLMSPATKQL